jgi:hypothetical protein
MKNVFRYVYDRIIDSLTGQEYQKRSATDLIIASNSETPSSSGTFSLVNFSVPAGAECIIGDVDFGASGAGTAEVTVTVGSVTITRYLYLSAAGFIENQHDIERDPFFAFVNATTASVTVNMNVLSAATTINYIGNVAYVIR